MYKYKIGYGSYEDSEYFEVEHEKLFTDEEFTDMIGYAAVEAIKKCKIETGYVHGLRGLVEYIPEYLISLYGFKEIKYDKFWNVMGWASVFVKGDWAGHDSAEERKRLDRIVEIVNEAGFSEVDDSSVETYD